MTRIMYVNNHNQNLSNVSLRLLKKEMKLAQIDINKGKRFLALLAAETHLVRTQIEKEVVLDFIEKNKIIVDFHVDRLERYQQCYEQLKNIKSFSPDLLFPEELWLLQKKGPLQTNKSASKKQELPKILSYDDDYRNGKNRTSDSLG